MHKLSDKQLVELLDKAVIEFKGDITRLESAIGMFIMARHFGWKVALLMHDRQTIKKYEEILGIPSLRDYVPDVGQYAHKSVAWVAVQKVSSFWKAVKGEIEGIKSPMIKST